MTRIDILADAFRGAYWITTACQGDAYTMWEMLEEPRKDMWRDMARRFEQRIERQGYVITKFAEDC